ncbi:uncharacterized protein LOC121414937 isoform X1 [Lytechinus variegatus]|uniref:uncharacterized protein LOC121414937 isoform X1 n=2 Tax=Lytechinus variegatus TaxID=7654 RepID=UPI001BB14B05|nr:uncharacterized protein LOC121414937 isoform X1 [Lytechinus variegatus]
MGAFMTASHLVFVMLVFVICSVNGQNKCYNCFGLGSTNSLLAQTASQYPISSCADIGQQTETSDCTGKCFVQNFTVNYNFQQASISSMDVEYLILGCGGKKSADGCQDFSQLPNFDEVKRQTENVVAKHGGRVTSMQGEACFCSGNLCNSATSNARTSVSLITLCLATYSIAKMTLWN